MKVLHLYPQDDQLIAEHVKILNNMDEGSDGDARPDIVHVHGCWQYKVVRQAISYHRQGARIVFTPHSGLEPWIIKERRLSEKLAKTLLWQRRLTEFSYVMIAHGKMEMESLNQLGWNPRVEMIRDAVVTNSITREAMVRYTQEVYHKVMDSNTLELMSADTQHLMSLLLKAGITGDKRWITEEAPDIDEVEWRRLLVYADHENVRTVIDRGIHVLGIRAPYIETASIKSYLPTDYQHPKVEAHDVAGIVAEMGHGNITLRHFVELDRVLRQDNVQDDWLCEALSESRQLKYFRRLLQVQTELTLLDEGFLPASPLNDRGTQAIRKLLRNHLRI